MFDILTSKGIGGDIRGGGTEFDDALLFIHMISVTWTGIISIGKDNTDFDITINKDILIFLILMMII